MKKQIFLILTILCTFTTSEKSTQSSSPTPIKATTPSIKLPKTTLSLKTTIELNTVSTEDSVTIDSTESFSTTLATCGTNDTDCLTTVKKTPDNSTTKSPDSNRKENKTTKKSQSSTANENHKEGTNICTCNLQMHFCDINCCCDPDCSSEDKKVFGYCHIDENRYYDTRYCNYIQHMYVNNTPFEWQVNQNGLFCVVTSNLPDSYVAQKKDPLDSFKAAELEKSDKFSWKVEENVFNGKFHGNDLKPYAFGDPLWIVRSDFNINKFRLPKNYLTKNCIFEEDIYYLKNVKNSCSQVEIDEENKQLSMSSYFANITVVASPKLLNLTKYQNVIYKNCPRNVCLEIKPKLCDGHLKNCTKVFDKLNTKFQCSYDIKNNINRCQNGVRKIHYNFYHNGTSGLFKVELLVVLQNFSYHFGQETFEFFQEFAAEFLWQNQTKNYSEIFSGNPGYMPGKPILIGSKVNNESSYFIQRNSSLFIDNFFTFSDNVNGECVKNESHNIPIEFGYNMITKCQINTKILVRGYQNASQVCKKIQENIFDMWGILNKVNKSLVVGLFGNSNSFNKDDWSDILYKINPRSFLHNTQGNFTNKNQTLECQNISTLFIVDIFYAKIDFKNILNQEKILGVSFAFKNIQNHSFSLQKLEASIIYIPLRFNLVSQVDFYDITTKKLKKFVDPPSFDIRLPYDFFYPFIKVDSSVGVVRPNVVITLFLYWILMLH